MDILIQFCSRLLASMRQGVRGCGPPQLVLHVEQMRFVSTVTCIDLMNSHKIIAESLRCVLTLAQVAILCLPSSFDVVHAILATCCQYFIKQKGLLLLQEICTSSMSECIILILNYMVQRVADKNTYNEQRLPSSNLLRCIPFPDKNSVQ